VVIVEGDVQAKRREESEALGIGRHPNKISGSNAGAM
jgi:hypothetical protein